MEIQAYLKILRRRWWILVLLPLITAGSAFGVSKFLMSEYVPGYPVYRASVQLIVEPARPDLGLTTSVVSLACCWAVASPPYWSGWRRPTSALATTWSGRRDCRCWGRSRWWAAEDRRGLK